MPFTFSHPAIVLPLTFLPQRWYSLTGLITGSLTPDFEYFIRMKIQSNYSHSLGGLFWFDLPLGVLLTFVFHNLVRNHLFDNLPVALNSRLSRFQQFDWNVYCKQNWLVVIMSLIIGAASHLLWDSFTHHTGYFVKVIPALQDTVEIAGKQVPLLKVLQHFSTLAGALVIAFAFWKLPIDEHARPKGNYRYWLVVGGVTLTIISLRLLVGLDYKRYGDLIATTICAILIALIVASLITPAPTSKTAP